MAFDEPVTGKREARIQLIEASGAFDREYYQACARVQFENLSAAIEHFLDHGEAAGLSPNPLYDRDWYERHARERRRPFLHILRHPAAQAGPQFDGRAYLAAHPDAAEHVGGALGHFTTSATASTLTIPNPQSGITPVTWAHLRQSMLDVEQPVRGEKGPVEGLTTVVVEAGRDDQQGQRRVIWALDDDADGIEMVIVGSDAQRQVLRTLSAIFASDPRVRCVANLHDDWRPAGDVVVKLDARAEPRPGWLAPLRRAALAPGVLAAQPLLLTPSDVVHSAGVAVATPGEELINLLAGHPVADAQRAQPIYPDAASGHAFAQATQRRDGMDGRVEVVSESHVTVADVCEEQPGRIQVGPVVGGRLGGSQQSVKATYARAGFEIHGSSRNANFTVSRPARVVKQGLAAGLPSLRWAIKNPQPAGGRRLPWGDTYFALDLADALQRLGQEVVIDKREAHQRPATDYLDDVVLWLHGRGVPQVQSGTTNLLWIISHPEDAADEMLTQGFDRIYSAGHQWAVDTGQRLGLPIETMWQATDPRRFYPGGPAQMQDAAVFVGNTRGVYRPIVRDALESGADLRIYGQHWDRFIDPSVVVATHVANSQLPQIYRGARVVLNDHWEDMAHYGFLSNRLFDAVASGARVVSDHVDGLADVFGSSVRTYRSTDELARLLAPGNDLWPSDTELVANAQRIAREHSFDQRARRMLADALSMRGVEHDLN